MRRTKRLSLLALLLVLALVAAACGGDEPEETTTDDGDAAAAGGEYSIHICEPSALIPQRVTETCGAQVLRSLYVQLIDYDEEGNPVNHVAESIESEDQQTWTITLQDGWTFHNGEPVDAESFVNAWNWGANGANAADSQYFFERIQGYDEVAENKKGDAEMEGLRVVDDRTFEVELKAPFSQFPLIIGYTAFSPLPDAFFEGNERQFNEAPIGNGPYQMDGRWKHDQFVKVSRYDDYAGTPGNADAIEFRIYADPNTAYTDVQAGNLDILEGIPTEVLAGAESEFGDNYHTRETSYFGFMGFPTYAEPWDQLEVRQAFSMAFDRAAITETIFQGAYTPAGSIISPVVEGHREGVCGEFCEYNPEKAKELWDEHAGDVDQITLWFNSDGGHEEWMEALSNQVRKNLDVQIKFESLEFAEYLELLENEEMTGPYRLAWVFDYPSPENYLTPLFACGASSNYTGHCNKEADAAMEEGDRAESIDAGIEHYQRAEELLLQDLPSTPTWFGVSHWVHTDDVENVIVDAFQLVRVPEVEVVNQ